FGGDAAKRTGGDKRAEMVSANQGVALGWDVSPFQGWLRRCWVQKSASALPARTPEKDIVSNDVDNRTTCWREGESEM
ncbi:MAG: hypothetical protein HKN47_29525, partial [Pirellulaceae bacterium]|nr:hypothetical protein [Pirellulaceae bacterium]